MVVDTQTYTVTKYAGPKVAGRVVTKGQTLELTENEARSEVLAGSIVEGKNGDKGFVEDPLAGSKELEPAKAQDAPLPQPTVGGKTDEPKKT